MRKALSLFLALLLCSAVLSALAERDGYLSLLLIGQDEPEAGATNGPATAIVIAALNLTNGSTRLLSVDSNYRAPQETSTVRLSDAHAFGGSRALLTLVNTLFDLPIDYYALVSKGDMAEIVGALGEVTVDVREEDLAPSGLEKAGPQLLNREQTVRYMTGIGGEAGESGRAERQRRVLTAIMEQVFSRGYDGMLIFAKAVLPIMKTNIPITKIMSAAAAVLLNGLSAPMQDKTPPGDAAWQVPDDGSLACTPEQLAAEAMRVDAFLYARE